MEKPDANGFVNISWPSKNIPHGGIFHNRQVEPTPQQQQFIKVLLEESKLDILQRQKSAYLLRRQQEKKPPPASEIDYPFYVRPRTSKRRSLSAIRASGIYDVDPYKPMKIGQDREKLKDKLINSMAFGDTEEQAPPPPPRLPKPPPKLPTEQEKWNELVTQIRERVEWLGDMEALGHAEPHREIIQDQIAERMRALDAIGIDIDTASIKSGFSTLRSRDQSVRSKASVKSNNTVKAGASPKHKGNISTPVVPMLQVAGPPKSTHNSRINSRTGSRKGTQKEENVTAYETLAPLKYSPRRRV